MSEGGAWAGLGGLLSQGGNYGISKDLSDQAWKRQKTILKKQIRWRVKDLRKAGLNPILAAGSSLGGGAPSVATGTTPDIGDAVDVAARTYSANRSKKAEIKNLEASAENNSAAAAKSREGAITERSHQNYLDEQSGAAAASARQSDANASLLMTEERLKSLTEPEAQMRSELHTNPSTKWIMKMNQMSRDNPITNMLPRIGRPRGKN